jgi:hypothetical protein
MSTTEFISANFASAIRQGNYRDAVASIMGQHPNGINRSKQLLIEFNKLDSSDQETILNWSQLPSEQLPVKMDQRWYVEAIARHEMAHIVAAKAMGFRTGQATLVLHSPDGLHQGTSLIHLDRSTPLLKDVSTYLEQRIIVLLAGNLAEPEETHERTSNAQQIINAKISESDLQKALELINLKLNIEGIYQRNAVEGTLYSLVEQASIIVETNFGTISSLAQKFATRINFYGQHIGWEGHEIDEQPEIQNIVPVQ